MTKRLLNLNTIQKITLILTTSLLLPMSSLAASFFTSGNISGSNNSYTWTYGGTKSWTITTNNATLDMTNAANLNATITNGGNITLSTTQPLNKTCKLRDIMLEGSASNCSIILKLEGSNEQYALTRNNDNAPLQYNFDTPQEWAESKYIEVIISQTNSESSASCNISKITIDIQELSDANFEWPTDLTSEDDISGIQRTEPNGVLLEGHCMKNTMFSFALQPQTTMTNQPEITYTSTKTEVATVDEYGQVTVCGTGQTTIKATIKETSSFYFDPAEHSYTLNITELDEDYGLTVGGIKVTSNNASNVFGDGKVSFDAGESILTLNNANIEPEVEAYGIEYTQNSNLTIKLIGTNTIKGKDGCEPFIYNVANPTNVPKLIFVNGDNQPCSIQIDSEGNQDAFLYFSEINHEGLFMINDYILGSDGPNISRTTITSTILSGGNGTAANPFLIKEPTDLINFAKYINNKTINSDVSVQLYNDINCQGLQGFEPIGNYSIYFSGTFDGNEKTISNLSANNVQLGAVGLFAILASGGKIENLTLSNCTIYGGNSSSNDIGILVGCMNGGEINNCTIQNSTISSLQNTQNPTVGGIVGSLNNGSSINNCIIQDCSIKAETNDKSASGANAKAGGIVGTITSGSISGCQVKGRTTVSADYGNYSAELSAGAIIAYNSAGSLSNNTYEYTVTTSTNDYNYDNETATLTTKSGYEQRGVGGKYYNEVLDTYFDNPDIIENNGAVLANTKKLTLPSSQENTGFVNLTSGYYKMEGGDYYVAADQNVKILVTPRGANATGSFTATNTSNNTIIETTTTSTSDGTIYSFTMPNSDVTVSVNFGIDIANEQFINATIEDAAYDGTEQVPTTVTLTSQEGGKINLKNNSDGTQFIIKSYKLNGETVSSPINVGTYTVTIEGIGNYAGTRDVQYTITKGYAGIMFYRMVDGQVEDVHTVQNTTYGVTYDAPLFRNPNNLNVTFYSKESNGLEGNNSEAVTIDENSNITINEAGTAYIFATTPGNDNYEEKTVSYKLIVAPGDLSSVTIAEISNQTYTGSDIEPAVTVTLNSKAVSTDDYDIAYSNNIDVSTDTNKATITLTAKSTSTRFAANTTKTATFSIIAKSLSEATMTLSETEYTYDGNAKNPSVTIRFESDGATGTDGTTGSATTLTEGTDYDVTYKKMTGESEEDITASQIITAGTYKVIATAKRNYTGSKEATFTITAATMTITANGYEGTYDTQAHGITVTTPEGSIVKYGSQEGTYTLDASPEYTDAGNYTIYYQVTMNNYNTVTGSATVEITKANITPTVTLEGWTYGTTANTPSITGNAGNGEVTYTYQAEGAETFTEAKPVIVGTHTVKASIAETTNYNAGEATATFAITAATMDVTAEGYKGTYDNEAHGITVTAPEDAIVMYGSQEGTYNLTNSLTYTDAGNYTVYYQVTMNNYTTTTGSATVEISKANITPTVTLEGWTYGATANTPNITGNTGNGNVTYTYKAEGSETFVDTKPEVVGTHTIKASIAESTNYNAGEATATFTITEATATVTAKGYRGAYDNQPHGITVTAPEGSTVKYGTQEGTYELSESPTYTNAGTNEVYYQVTKENYTTVTGCATIEISKADITPTVTLEGWTYGTTAKSPSITGNTGNGDVTYTYKAEGTETYTEAKPVVVGTHTVKASIAETTNYNSGEATATFTITAATMTVTAAGYKGTYDNKTHGITVTAPEGAKVRYGTQEGTYNLTDLPTYTNAGNYTVYYQVSMDNYTTTTGSATVEIIKANITPTVSLEGWTYGTTAKSPSVTGNTGEGTVIYTYKAEGAESFGETKPTVVGTHTIQASIAETTNYNAGEATATFTITAATMTVTAKGYEGTYDNKAHGITVTAPEGATVMYGTQEGTYGLTESPTYTNAGTNEVYYQVTKDNYTTVTGSETVEISKANITPTVSLEGWIYGTTANTPSITGNTGDGAITYSYKAEGSETFAETKPVVIGTHTIKASIAETTNYNAGEATTTFTITAATMSVTAAGYKGTYDTQAHGITVTAPDGATVKYGTQEGKYDLTESPTYTNAVTNEVYYQVTKDNYTTVTGSATVEINKADITPTVTLEGWTYGATANSPSITGNTGNGTITYTYKAEGAEEFTEAQPAFVGTHTIKASIAETTNYNEGEATTTFTITAATMTVTAEGYKGTYDNEAHGITVTAPEGSIVKYGSLEDTYNLTESPKYTDAGTYIVHYQVTMDNYTTTTGSATLEISKADITPTVTLKGWTYGSTINTPSITGNTGNGSVTYTYKAEGAEEFTEDMPEVVGTHTIKASIAESTNYNAGEATATFTITAATTPVTAKGYKGAYDKQSHGVTVTAPDGATVKYGTQKGTYNLTESPTYTDAGTYKIHYQVTMDNHTTITDSATVEISKADITPTVTLEGWTYGTTANSPSITGNTGNGAVTYTYKVEGSETFVEAKPEVVGTHTVKASIAETTNYNSGEITATFTITAGTMSVTAAGYKGTYDTKTHGITVTAPEGATVKYGSQKGTYNLTESPTYTDAGTYKVHYQVTMDNYSTITDSATVEISKADITPTVTLEGWIYGTTANTPSITGNTGNGNVIYTYKAEGAEEFTENMPEVVGTHTIKASIAETTNYNAGEATATFTITEATATVTAKGYRGAYDNQPHGISVTAPDGAIVMYGTQKGKYELTESPTYTDAGTYKVHYQVTMENYSTITDSATVEISKADITPTVTLEGWTYGTTAKSPSITGNTGNGNVTYTYKAEGAEEFTENMPEVVGTHTIKASIAETTNYNAGEATATFTITAATMTVTAKGYEGTYDGKAHGITVSAPEDATIKYGTAEGSYELNASPEYTAGGNYTVYYQVTMDNYATVTGSETVKISKAEAELEFDVPEESKVYATIGKEFTEPTLNNLKGLDVTFSSSDESVATVDKNTGKVTLKSAGLTYITATFAGNDNYNEFAVKYELRVKGSYNLWIDNVQVTSDNYNDILENQKFFYDLVNKWLIITNNETPVTVKSSMPELTIYLNGKSELERIYFDNQGNAQNTGTLSFFNYNDVPGKLTLDTNNDNGVISGFSSISFDDNTKLRFIDPDSCEYKDGLVKMTKPSQLGEIVKQVTIGQYIEPMANGDGISFGNIDSETNITNMTIEDKLLITATQHEEGSNEDDDYIDPNNGAFVMNTTNTSEDVEVLSQGVESGNKQPGSEDYADSFRGGITFMIPSGTGTIELELMNEEGYMLMLKIGTGVPHEIVRYERATVVIDYNVDEPTYVYLYLEEKSIIGARRAGNNTRVGKRDKAHGTVFSVKVKAASVSSTNPLNNVEGATGNITIPDVNTTTPSGDDVPTKAEFKITNDENKANDDKWYTIDGQRINKPTQKGLYIRNRKKVVVK
ncbi:MAG: hypothetical protein E7102_12390 [Prevotella ruminicola]|jgi:hypothetical protein|uniref:BIG2 domain-containing protein n=1 Tax=Xylanibacter ruminicola TaxID=839 RepID=A0A928BUU6_XYLRU|nr:hypothetical protein [Xylanibacter ruminicola]